MSLMPAKRPDAAALIERVRALAFPDVTEKLSHGEPAFFVRKRMPWPVVGDLLRQAYDTALVATRKR